MFENIVVFMVFLCIEAGLLKLCYKNRTALRRRQWTVSILGVFACFSLAGFWLSPIRGAEYASEVLQPNLWFGWTNIVLLVLYMLALVIRGIKEYGLAPTSS